MTLVQPDAAVCSSAWVYTHSVLSASNTACILMHHNTNLLIGFIACSLTVHTNHFSLCSRLYSLLSCVLLCNLGKGTYNVNFEIRFETSFLFRLFSLAMVWQENPLWALLLIVWFQTYWVINCIFQCSFFVVATKLLKYKSNLFVTSSVLEGWRTDWLACQCSWILFY